MALIIDRKAHRRKGFMRMGTLVNPAYVDRTIFKAKDRGKPGRGKRVLPRLKKGTLGVDFKWSPEKRRSREAVLAKRVGERSVIGKLRAVQILNKRTNPVVSKKAASDARFIAASFIKRRRVPLGQGWSGR